MSTNFFRSRGVATRLWLGFGLVIALLLAVATFSLKQLERLQQQADQLVSQHIGTLDTVGQMQEIAAQRSLYLRDMVMNDSLAAQREVASKLQANSKAHADISRRFAALADTSAAGTAREDVKRLLEMTSRIGLLEQSALQQVADARFDEAKAFLAATLSPQHEQLNRLLREFFVATMADASASVKGNRQQHKMVLSLMAAMTLIAIGMGAAIALFTTRGIVGPVEAARQAAMKMAGGDLTQSMVSSSSDEIGQLVAALEQMRLALALSVTEIRAVAGSVGIGSREIERGNADLSARTEDQAASLEETASSIEALTTTVEQNAQSAAQASQVASAASDIATRGGEAMRGVVATMQGIHESSVKIADIIGVIDAIAFQTNILALNAAVEAARAGDQGRGFAVVAGEVRSLAQRSAQAAKEIKGLIRESAGRVGGGMRQVEDAGKTLDEIVASASNLNGLIAGIADASAEQLSGIEQVNRAIAQMDLNTQQNASMVGQAAAAAQHMASQAQVLVAAVTKFRVAGADGVNQREALPPAGSQAIPFQPMLASAAAQV